MSDIPLTLSAENREPRLTSPVELPDSKRLMVLIRSFDMRPMPE